MVSNYSIKVNDFSINFNSRTVIEGTQHPLILQTRNQVPIPLKIGTEIIVLLIELVVVREEAIAHAPEKEMTVLMTRKGKKLLSKDIIIQ